MDELKAGLSDVTERVGALEAEVGEVADEVSIAEDAAVAAEDAVEMAEARSAAPVETPKVAPVHPDGETRRSQVRSRPERQRRHGSS